MIKAFVTGYPVLHSKSPMLHGHWIQFHNIDGSYEPVEVKPESFEAFLATIRSSGFSGGNITIPHKETAFELVPNKDAAALAIGAVNTLWFENGELCGSNTDAYGFAANMDDYAGQWRDGSTATILGAGGAAKAVVYAIKQAGYDRINIINRTVSRADALAEWFGDACSAHGWDVFENLLPETDLLVNTTSLGMDGHGGGDEPAFNGLSGLQSEAIVTDIVYTPLETPILRQANALGYKTVDGLGMLLHQAVPGFERWFGVRPEVTAEVRDLILEAL